MGSSCREFNGRFFKYGEIAILNSVDGDLQEMRYKRFGGNIWTSIMLGEGKSKIDHETGQILTDFDDFGVVEELRFRAFQRHQNHQHPLRFAPLHGPDSIFRM